MAAGYGFGALLTQGEARRKKLLALGVALTLGFILLRAANFYGDPRPWAVQKSALFTAFSFVNCTKYPPSLLYLLMTLGPAILLLAMMDRVPARFVRPMIVLGRVPMFFYLLHLPLIHLLAAAVAYPRWELALGSFYFTHPPSDSGYGHGLAVVYGVWLLAVAMLYPLCRWFAGVKQRRRERWLGYL